MEETHGRQLLLVWDVSMGLAVLENAFVMPLNGLREGRQVNERFSDLVAQLP